MRFLSLSLFLFFFSANSFANDPARAHDCGYVKGLFEAVFVPYFPMYNLILDGEDAATLAGIYTTMKQTMEIADNALANAEPRTSWVKPRLEATRTAIRLVWDRKTGSGGAGYWRGEIAALKRIEKSTLISLRAVVRDVCGNPSFGGDRIDERNN